MRRAGHKGEGAGFMCEGPFIVMRVGFFVFGWGGSLQKEAGLK